MIRITDSLIGYIKSETGYDITDVDIFHSGDNPRLMIRTDFGEAVTTRYWNGDRLTRLSISILSREKQKLEAMQKLEAIERALDLPSGYQLGDCTIVRCELQASATMEATTSELESVYVSTFELEFYEKLGG